MNAAAVLLGAAALLLSFIALLAPRRPAPPPAPRDPEPALLRIQAGLRILEDRLNVLESRGTDLGLKASDRRNSPTDRPAMEPAPESADSGVGDLFEGVLTAEALEEKLARVRKKGMQNELLKAAEKHVEAHPEDARAHYLLARALIERLMIDPSFAAKEELGNRSLREYEKAIALDPQFWEPRFEKAESLTYYPESLGKTPEAIRDFEALLALQGTTAQDPRFAKTYAHLGRLYLRVGKSDRALKTIQEGVRLFPQDEDLRGQLELLQRK